MKKTEPPSTEDVSAIIARRLRAVREQVGCTQAWLAETIGVSTELVSRIERGRTLPSLETLMRLSWALGATPNDLLVDAVPEGDALQALFDRLRAAPPTVIENVAYLAEAALAFDRRVDEGAPPKQRGRRVKR